MYSVRPSRRSVLVAGFAAVALGAGGWALRSADSGPGRGAEGFTAGTAPEETDPILFVDPSTVSEQEGSQALADALLAQPAFEGVAGHLGGAFDGSGPVDIAALDKLLVVGSGVVDGSAAVVWADWSPDRLASLLGENGRPENGTYAGQRTYETDKSSAAVLGDGIFALGTPRVVRSIVDVWHGDAKPISRDVLEPFERTHRNAPVRFATTGLAFKTASADSRTQAYETVTNTSVSITAGDDNTTVTVSYEVGSTDADDPLAAALRRDLGLSDVATAVEPALPRGVRGDLAVRVDTETIVTVEYRARDDSVRAQIENVLETLGSATAG